jgi:tetratricopeptide (TPR) repeat protein
VLIVFLVLAGVVSAQQVRKLPEGAYLKTAKIEMGYGEANQDTVRYKNAMAMLDSLFLYYGPNPEALSLMSRIMVAFVEKAPGPKAKEQWVDKFAILADSLKWACANKDIKAGNKKGCKDFVSLADSTRVKFWREFYNNGIAQMNIIDDLNKQLDGTVTDSTVIAANKEGVVANADTALINFKLCVRLDTSAALAYIALGTLYQKQKNFDAANDWLTKGLKLSTDSSQILMSVAYNYIEANKYCDAVPFFREYLRTQPKDTSTMYNLTVCYARCKMLDSAVVWYRKMLDLSPANYDALNGLGGYFNTLALQANDSARFYNDAKNEAGTKKWNDIRTQRFDSSYTYFKAAYATNPKEAGSAEEYAVVSAILQKFDEALAVYGELTKLNPGSTNYWSSLGDCYYSLKQWDKAAGAYEKVAELDPTNRPNLEHLRDAYDLGGQAGKKAEIEKKLK